MEDAPSLPQPPRGWVVLGTDTGVGKTFISCQIIRALSAQGFQVKARKPVETGCATEGEGLIPADATALWAAAGRIESLETVCPLRLIAPLAPPQAAQREGFDLRFLRDIAPHLPPLGPLSTTPADPADTLWWIEGAGGLLSPLADDALGVELARYSGLPVILVAPDRLGTLSALFSAIETLSHRQIVLSAIVLNRRPEDCLPASEPQPDNLSLLHAWLPKLLAPTRCPPIVINHPTLTGPTFEQQIITALLN